MIYDVLYESLIGAKSLRITFDKVDRLIRDYDGTKYLVLFGPEKYDAIESDNDLLLKITLLCMMLSYLLIPFLIKITTSITIKPF